VAFSAGGDGGRRSLKHTSQKLPAALLCGGAGLCVFVGAVGAHPCGGRISPRRVLARAEVERLLKAVGDLKLRTALMTIYSAGLRISEVMRLTARDIDSARMVICVRGTEAEPNWNIEFRPFEPDERTIRGLLTWPWEHGGLSGRCPKV
jgi:integrase